MGISGVPLSKSDIIKAIKAKKGILRHAAEMLGCNDKCLYDWVGKDLDVERVLKESRKQREIAYEDQDFELVDEARQALLRTMRQDNVQSAMFVAKTKGKFESQNESGDRVTVIVKN